MTGLRSHITCDRARAGIGPSDFNVFHIIDPSPAVSSWNSGEEPKGGLTFYEHLSCALYHSHTLMSIIGFWGQKCHPILWGAH